MYIRKLLHALLHTLSAMSFLAFFVSENAWAQIPEQTVTMYPAHDTGPNGWIPVPNLAQEHGRFVDDDGTAGDYLRTTIGGAEERWQLQLPSNLPQLPTSLFRVTELKITFWASRDLSTAGGVSRVYVGHGLFPAESIDYIDEAINLAGTTPIEYTVTFPINQNAAGMSVAPSLAVKYQTPAQSGSGRGVRLYGIKAELKYLPQISAEFDVELLGSQIEDDMRARIFWHLPDPSLTYAILKSEDGGQTYTFWRSILQSTPDGWYMEEDILAQTTGRFFRKNVCYYVQAIADDENLEKEVVAESFPDCFHSDFDLEPDFQLEIVGTWPSNCPTELILHWIASATPVSGYYVLSPDTGYVSALITASTGSAVQHTLPGQPPCHDPQPHVQLIVVRYDEEYPPVHPQNRVVLGDRLVYDITFPAY